MPRARALTPPPTPPPPAAAAAAAAAAAVEIYRLMSRKTMLVEDNVVQDFSAKGVTLDVNAEGAPAEARGGCCK